MSARRSTASWECAIPLSRNCVYMVSMCWLRSSNLQANRTAQQPMSSPKAAKGKWRAKGVKRVTGKGVPTYCVSPELEVKAVPAKTLACTLRKYNGLRVRQTDTHTGTETNTSKQASKHMRSLFYEEAHLCHNAKGRAGNDKRPESKPNHLMQTPPALNPLLPFLLSQAASKVTTAKAGKDNSSQNKPPPLPCC